MAFSLCPAPLEHNEIDVLFVSSPHGTQWKFTHSLCWAIRNLTFSLCSAPLEHKEINVFFVPSVAGRKRSTPDPKNIVTSIDFLLRACYCWKSRSGKHVHNNMSIPVRFRDPGNGKIPAANTARAASRAASRAAPPRRRIEIRAPRSESLAFRFFFVPNMTRP